MTFATRAPIDRFLVLLVLGALSAAGCGEPPDGSSDEAAVGDWGVETVHLSDSVAPGDNFYRYVNEGWIEQTEVPPGYSFFNEPWAVQEQVLDDVDVILQEAIQAGDAASPIQKRVADLYQSFLDTAAVEQRGLTPIADDLEAIQAITSHDEVARWMAKPMGRSLYHLLVKPPVDMQGGYVLTVDQYRVTGLGLPAQVYYESTDAPFPDHRRAYVEYIAATLSRAGIDRGEERAEAVLALETQFAERMWDFAQLRDAGAAFNIVPVAQLTELAPGFPWEVYLDAKGVAEVSEINVGLGAIPETAALFGEIPVEDWRSFLLFHWVDMHASMLPSVFGEASFAFYDQRLYGVEEATPRSEQAVEFVERHLGDDIGRLYVERHFPKAYHEPIEEMVELIRDALRGQLLATEWMDEPTRAEALKKLEAVIVEVAEPQVGIDWAGLETRANDLAGNVARLRAYRWAGERERIGQPITRYGDWNMYPHRIGAGYHQQYNKIFLTAGALLPPFFDPAADPAVNFGAIGQTIAHEFGHALDDQGAKFDSNGALRDWWSDASRQAYEQRTAALIEQFGQYETLPGTSLQSEQMIGEIVGDLVGTSIAYRAYEQFIADKYGGEAPVLGGFTGRQRFWLGSAQHTRTVAQPEALRDMALHWSHPPAEFRVNGILANLGVWYQDFNVGPDAELYIAPADRVVLW
ncbi:MAG: M13 family metallopeptidase [Bacteroidota bacterium]